MGLEKVVRSQCMSLCFFYLEHLGICYLLLNATADVESPMGGLKPLQLAEMFGNEAIIGLIKMHVKKFKLENKMFA